MTASGLLIGGRAIPVAGLDIVNSNDAKWCVLRPDDYRMRKTKWVRGICVHSTGGRWPMPLDEGPGPGGECERYADIWQTDPTHSAAHLVVDSRGRVACLADLKYVCAYHATSVNDVAVGIEMAQMRDGRIHRATVEATAVLCKAICDHMEIPFQFCATPYSGGPLDRLTKGGADCVGIYGHRDQSDQRGRGDPGDAVYIALEAAGAEPLDYSRGQDIEVGKARQRWLNAAPTRAGSPLVVDGLIGPASLAAARRQGFPRWRDVPTG